MSIEFLLTSLIVAVIPGTGVVYTVASSMGGGRRRGIFASIGCTLGIVPHMLAAMIGLSGVMYAGSLAFEVVRWAGVAYLVYMGISMMRGGGAISLDGHEPPDESFVVVIRRGVLLNILNPKLTVFFFAFLPQFLDAPAGVFDPRLVWLGAVFMLVTFVVFAAYACASAAARNFIIAAPRVRLWIERFFGAVFIAFAARLALTDR